jgi:predicted TIM-barrel fold metal-dependent hydrolase
MKHSELSDFEIIDSHVHVFPDRLEGILPSSTLAPWNFAKLQAQRALRPVTRSLHSAQTLVRHLPEALRWGIDQVGGLAPLPLLLIESTPRDLKKAMKRSSVNRAIIIAHPPWTTNDFLLELAESDPDGSWIVAVRASLDAGDPVARLNEEVERGAKALKLHPADEGKPLDHPSYLRVLEAAGEMNLPVILHTGCFHNALLYRNSDLGDVTQFESWFKDFPRVTFILAHTNFHDPGKAFDLAENYPQLLVETSWQPAETIGEAVRRIGAERVLFGSDWPLLGNNMSIGIRRVLDAHRGGFLSAEHVKMIFSENAKRVFKLQPAEALHDAVEEGP